MRDGIVKEHHAESYGDHGGPSANQRFAESLWIANIETVQYGYQKWFLHRSRNEEDCSERTGDDGAVDFQR